MEIDYGSYACHFRTIQARIYSDFHPDTFEYSLNLVFNVYVEVFRNATLVTVYPVYLK